MDIERAIPRWLPILSWSFLRNKIATTIEVHWLGGGGGKQVGKYFLTEEETP